MLSPGDKVFIDDQPTVWTIVEASRRGPLGGGSAKNFYRLAGWSDPDEEITPDRITDHYVES